MAYSAILKPSTFMNPKIYTGNGGTNNITGVGFKPDLTWLKRRNGTANHHLVDSVRGVGYYLYANLTNAQGGNGSALLTSFNTDGFTLDAGADSNASGATGVSWNWKAGTSFTNDASGTGIGSIDSAGSVNTTSGFSITSFTGTQTAGTIAHGLGAVPKMIIVKSRTQADGWYVYHVSNTATKYMRMETTGTLGSGAAFWNDTAPTSTVFSVGNGTGTNYNGAMIAYCFAEKQGFSKIASYTGNGNADGTFIYTGFKPAFVFVKRTNSSENWTIMDSARDPVNAAVNKLHPNTNGGTDAGETIDILSNGFKNRTTNAGANGSGDTYIYMAFAEEPLVASNYNAATAR